MAPPSAPSAPSGPATLPGFTGVAYGSDDEEEEDDDKGSAVSRGVRRLGGRMAA
jgi:hypothetical protein